MPRGRMKPAPTRQGTRAAPAGRRSDPPEPAGDAEALSPQDAERIRRSNRAGDMDDLTLPEYRSRGREQA